MSGRRPPPPPPRPYIDDSRSGYRENRGEPSDRRRRSPSPGYSRSSRNNAGERDWRKDERVPPPPRRDGGGRSDRAERGDYRSRDRDDRYMDRPPRPRPSAYDNNGLVPRPRSPRRHRDEPLRSRDDCSRPSASGRRSRSPQALAPSAPTRHGGKAATSTEGQSGTSQGIGAEAGEEGGEEGDRDEAEGDEDAMAAMMGFGGFGTTKGKKVAGNAAGAAEVKKERTWRQYMNRKGGFNRPLDKIK
ncbi:hypothetical protein NDA13_005764 [Ustilago tritici]|nr:hypothetical protein NDA13_005764 [Ustilago tritici]